MRLCLLLYLVLCVPAAWAQPFETLEIGLGGHLAFGEHPYSDFWEPGPGVLVRIETPFYLGRVVLAGTAAPHRATDTTVPDYWALHASAGWGYPLALGRGVEVSGGAHAGLFAMWFDVDDVSSVRREAELATGLDVRLGVPLGRGWRASAGARTTHVFTAERMNLRSVHLGVSRRFVTPRWLREVLR